MRILLESNHQYPSGGTNSTGFHPNPWVTGGASIVHDLLAKGLAELGHEVFYLLPKSHRPALPRGVHHLLEPVFEVDVFHHYNNQFLGESIALEGIKAKGVPWLASCHNHPQNWWTAPDGDGSGQMRSNWVCVSQSLAESLNHSRFVRNGIDPGQFRYNPEKSDYLLFMSNMNHMVQVHNKGLYTALGLSRELGFRLVVAGSFRNYDTLNRVAELCRNAGCQFIGDVRGQEKADLLAGARALLFPTRLNEAFGLVIAEALVSGTPVICSDKGACAELVPPDCGFVCPDPGSYKHAFEQLSQIQPSTCRSYAMASFHYHRMAKDFVHEYRQEIRTRLRGVHAR